MVAPVRNTRTRTLTRVAISPTDIVATGEDFGSSGNGSSAWRSELASPPGDGALWPALGVALRQLAAATGNAGALSVALLAPLTEVRRIELPPLRDDERVRLLSRSASRYFLGATEAQTVGIAPAPKGNGRAVVCAAVPARLIATIHAEAHGAGWTVDNIVPAEAAWSAGIPIMWPALARGAASLLVAHDDRVDLIQVKDSRIVGVRRFRSGTADADAIVDAIRDANGAVQRVAALGIPDKRRELEKALADRGIATNAVPANWNATAISPAAAAAAFIAPNEQFRLRTEDAVALRSAQAARIAWQVSGVALLLLLGAAGLEWWGVKRELHAVKEQRASIAPQIRELLSGQQTNNAAARKLLTITQSHQASPQWSAAIASLSGLLDNNAYLLTLRARGDTLLLDGLAARSSEVFASVEKVPGFSAVRAAGEMRVERQDDGTMLERFTIQARVARDAGKTQ